MEPIVKQRVLRAAPHAVWAALTDPGAIRAWMGEDSTVEFDLRPGGRYRLFGGETTGTIESFEVGRRLNYSWRQAEWRAEWEDSRVEWTLAPAGTGTHLHLVHDGFPNQQERDGHDEGWDEYFLGPLQQSLEQPR
jgi:uncharacterized protein YndB with AHSA1/START domain